MQNINVVLNVLNFWLSPDFRFYYTPACRCFLQCSSLGEFWVNPICVGLFRVTSLHLIQVLRNQSSLLFSKLPLRGKKCSSILKAENLS